MEGLSEAGMSQPAQGRAFQEKGTAGAKAQRRQSDEEPESVWLDFSKMRLES